MSVPGSCQELEIGKAGAPRARFSAGAAGNAANRSRTPPPLLDRRLFVLPALLGRHRGDLLEDMNGRRLLGRERQLQVTDEFGRWHRVRNSGP